MRHFASQPWEDPIDMSSDESPLNIRGIPPLSIKSRELIQESFAATMPIRQPPGHLTIAINQEQVGAILRVVADEAAKASFEMLNIVVEKASLLSLGPSRNKAPQPMHRPKSVTPGTTETDFASLGPVSAPQGEASERTFSEENFWATGTFHGDTANREGQMY